MELRKEEQYSSCEWFSDISKNKYTNVKITLNENPMYFDEGGSRKLNEPFYQIMIRLQDTSDNNTNSPSMLIYEYFDSPTDEKAERHVLTLFNTIRSLGFEDVKVALCINE